MFSFLVSLMAGLFLVLPGWANNKVQSPLQYSEVEIWLKQPAQFRDLSSEGLIFDHIKILDKENGGVHFKTVLNERELDILKQSAIPFKIVIPDVVQDYLARNEISSVTATRENLPAGFEYGSMGGFYTYDEVVSELDSMHLNYPNLTSGKQSLGLSIENRDLWMIKVSDNPDVDENEPEVFFTALHHAREPEGLMVLMYFLDYILEKYGSDAEITYLIDHREIYVLPVLNPDGYVYNEQTNPDGGGQWRKNRRPVQNWYGVDLNRNYGYQWGYDDEGSSPFPFSDTYRGSAPFSEPETQAVRDFVNSRNFKCVLNYHTYGNVLIYPWSYINALTPDSLFYMEFADLLTRQNHYNFGNTYQTINYNANGDSDDWLYGEQDEKPKVIASTPEAGGDDDGFWPTQDRIVPICKQNLKANLNYVWLAGSFPQTRSWRIISDDNQNGLAEVGEQLTLVCFSKNIGLTAGQNISVSLSSDLAGLETVNTTHNHLHTSWASQQVVSDTFLISVNSDVQEGSKAWLTLNYQLDGFTLSDTLGALVIGTPIVVFSDDAENGLDNWQTGQGWGIETDTLQAANRAFSDSPYARYQNNADNILSLKQALQLPQADYIYLTYQTHWDVERVYDFATVEISSDSINWQTLQTRNMLKGSGKGQQSSSQSGYDGFRHYWQQEWIDISGYQAGGQAYLRFRLQSDGGVPKDGWYLDNIQVFAYNSQPSALTTKENSMPLSIRLWPVFPNPFNASATLRYSLNTANPVELSLFNTQGEKVATLINKMQSAGEHIYKLQADQLASGVYFVRLRVAQQVKVRKLILLK